MIAMSSTESTAVNFSTVSALHHHEDSDNSSSNPENTDLNHPDTSGCNSEETSHLISHRIAQLQKILDSLHHYHDYRETIPAVIEAYRSGQLTIEPGQFTFWARKSQQGPTRKLENPTTEGERLNQQVVVMEMMDEALKLQHGGDLVWIENLLPED